METLDFSYDNCKKLQKELNKTLKSNTLYVDYTYFPEYVIVAYKSPTSRTSVNMFKLSSTSDYNDNDYWNRDCFYKDKHIGIGGNGKTLVTKCHYIERSYIQGDVNVVIKSPDKEAIRVAGYIKNRACVWAFSWNKITNFIAALHINPRLIVNVIDALNIEPSKYHILGNLYRTASCPEKSSIKENYPFPLAAIKAILYGQIHVDVCLFLNKLHCEARYYNNFTNMILALPVSYQNMDTVKYLTEMYEIREKALELQKTDDIFSTYTYSDYVRMRERLPDNLKKNFQKYPRQLRKKHDELIEVNQKCQLAIREAFLKNYTDNIYPTLKHFEYSDSKYSVVVPSNLMDLVNEGAKLHHCVGSYVDSVGEGREYIMFLRHTNDLETPFYTINVTTRNKIRQVHGLRNCNVTPEIKDFIEKWAKINKLDASNYSGIYCHL